MGVRVQIEVEKPETGQKVITSALLNTGFESDSPELLVPAGMARALGLLPNMPNGATSEHYESVAGAVFLYRMPESMRLRVIVEGASTSAIDCWAVISPIEREAILNDTAISALHIELSDPKSGLWRFVGEKGTRQGSAPQWWSD